MILFENFSGWLAILLAPLDKAEDQRTLNGPSSSRVGPWLWIVHSKQICIITFFIILVYLTKFDNNWLLNERVMVKRSFSNIEWTNWFNFKTSKKCTNALIIDCSSLQSSICFF